MDVSIIIVNYNTCRMTAECIDSVRQKTVGISYEIILVDNGSTDGSKEVFEKFEGIKYIYSDENLGFGRANNLGAKYASGEYLFLLNSDTLLINNAIKILYDYIRVHKRAGVVGGNLYGEDGSERISFERTFHGIYYTINKLSRGVLDRIRFGHDIKFNYSALPIKVAYISGADIMVRNDVFNNINGFDDHYFMYYEETDLCFRINKLGHEIISVPDAKIIHLEGGTVNNKNVNVNKLSMIMTSRRMFMNLNHGKLYRFVDRLLMQGWLYLSMIYHKDVATKEVYRIFIDSYK